MKIPQVALTTFLKLCMLTEAQKKSAYRKYFMPGDGYDFYWSLKKCVSKMTFEGKTYDGCVGEILNPLKNTAERKHNTDGLKEFVNWYNKWDRKFFAPPSGVYSSPKGYLKIKLKPEFGLQLPSERRVVAVWNTVKPQLTPFYGGVGIHLMNEVLKEGEFADCKFTMLDLRRPGWIVAEGLPRAIPVFLRNELAWIDNFFEEISKAA